MSDIIEWHDAEGEYSKENNKRQEEQEKWKQEHKEMVDGAERELWDAMGTEHFRASDFDDICSSYGIDSDDLLDRLI